MKLSKEQIKGIAEELDAGMKVFINKENLEIKSVLDWDNLMDDTGFWENELETIYNEWSDFIILEKLESREAFQIMEEFIDEVDDELMKNNLLKILDRKSPFANFKMEVETSEYRQKWFDFKLQKYIEYLKNRLELEGLPFDE